MSVSRTKLRRIVVASLLVGLMAAGASTCPLAGASCAPAAASATHCCCGPDCNGKCGAACCQSPAPKQDRNPATPKSADEFSPTWGLPLSSVAIAAPAAELRQALTHDSVLSLSGETLLALCIRLNL